jgi:hypothetical protein
MKHATVLLVLTSLLMLAGGGLAMSSTNYRLDWHTPLTSGGGGPASSANYGLNLTVGQTAVGVCSSSSYQACLGYWCGGSFFRIYLPLVMRG